MNYQAIYNRLILRAKTRIFDGYTERHHIIPRCLGGSDDPENLVPLTPEEHYIAHQLLVKIYPGNGKLVFAAHMMMNRNNKSYGWIKRQFSQYIRVANKGQIVTSQQREKMSIAQKGKRKSNEWKKKIGDAHTQKLEYNGVEYIGYEELMKATGVSYHLYNKYYKNGIDPSLYINNRTHGMVAKAKSSPAKNSQGKCWYNNGEGEKYFTDGHQPKGWSKGRLKKTEFRLDNSTESANTTNEPEIIDDADCEACVI